MPCYRARRLIACASLLLALLLPLTAFAASPNGEDANAAAGPALIFEDGFETETSEAWAATVPAVELRVVGPLPGAAVNDALAPLVLEARTITGVAIDVTSVTIQQDGASLAATCFAEADGRTLTCTPDSAFSEGPVNLVARVRDLLGRSSRPAATSFTVDTVAPTITVDSPSDGALTADATVVVTGSIDEDAALTVDSAPVVVAPDLRFTTDPLALGEGLNTLTFAATDVAGNLGQRALDVTRDSTPPDVVDAGQLVILPNLDGAHLDVTGGPGAAEPGATVRIENLSTGAMVAVIAGPDGSFAISIAGVSSDVLRFVVADAVDNVSPVADVDAPWQLPVDPATVAPPHDPTIPLDWRESLAFLYEGPNPIQTGVAPGTIVAKRVAWLRGRVVDRGGQPLGGVRVSVQGQPELGRTLTRADGQYDLVVNGGDVVVLDFDRPGLLPAQREILTPWRDARVLDDVVLIPFDPVVTTILAEAPAVQLAESTPQTDADGTRQATVLFPPNTEIELAFADGSTQTLGQIDVRATEYTVGDSGPAAMPGEIPPLVAYTYAVELSADEAVRAGAKEVRFGQPVYVYVDNFLDFPVGERVPAGFYDRDLGRWQAADNGRVIEILSVDGAGQAMLDIDGSGTSADPKSLSELGVTAEELIALAGRWPIGAVLWRVPAEHFTPWDYNWPFSPPDDAEPPPDEPENPDEPPDPDNPDTDDDDSDDNGDPQDPGDDAGGDDADGDGECDSGEDCVPPAEDPTPEEECGSEVGGSIISCESQTMRQMHALVGTPYRLAYASDRSEGFDVDFTLRIPVTGAEPLPSSVTRVRLEVSAGGQIFRESFDPQNGIVWTRQLTDRDGLGRRIQGSTPVRIRRGYEYELVYRRSRSEFRQSWAQQPGDAFPTRLRRRSSRITFWRETVTRLDSLVRPTVGGFDAKGFGLGGWNVDVHHVYDPARRTLYRGDGTQRVSWALGPVLNLFAGVGTSGYTGDGGDAKAARFDFPGDAAVGPDGSVYVADRSNYVVRRIAPSGIVTTVAGSGDRCVLSGGGSKGENGDDEGKGGGGPGTGEPCAEDLPALDASFNAITGIDVDRFGRLYIVDRLQRCVFRLEAGIVRRVAGVCALPDDGGGGKGERGAAEGFGDGSPALDAFFDAPFDVAVMPDGTFYISDRDGDLVRYVLGGRIYSIETSEALFFSRPQSLHAVDDGTLYIAENQRILRYDRSGTLSVIAGTSVDAISPDGADAATSPIDEPGGVLATDDGRVYFVEQGSQTLRYVDGEGTLRTAAGNGQRNDTAPGAPARATPMRGPQGLALSPSGVVLIVDGFQDRIFALEGPMSDYDDDGYRVTEPGGRVIHEFDAQGRHLQTVHGLTSATLLSFGYDDAGLLTSITDADGQATTVARGGATTTITGPFGQVNTLAIDAQGDLASLANPASEAHSFTYGFGLLEAATDPRGGVKAYRYDARGRLETAEDEGDGRQTFSRFKRRGSDDHTVRRTTAEGVESRFVLRKWSTGQELRTQRLPDGETVETVTNRATGETTRVTLADAQLRRSRAPDPRFGMQAGFDQRAVARMPSGLTRERTTTQSASFATPGDLSTFESLRTTSTINGRTSTRDYDAATRRWTVTSAAGRIAQVDTDARARITRLASPQAAPVTTTYTASGRIETLTRGASPGTSRVTQFGYDARNRLDTITDPTLRVLRFEHDDADRVTRIVLPDTAAIDLDHDVNGNLIAVTPPGRSAYGFTYTPTNRLETLTLPDTGQGVATETRVYDRDQRLTGITRHDGRQIAYAYDPDEQQLVAITSPRGVTTLRYDEPTDQLAQIVDPDGETLAFTYDGPLRTGVAWSGTVQGDVDWTFDSDFRPATESVNGADPITYSYDPDSRLLGAGALVVTREPTTGREATTALGLVGSTRTYTPFGELDTHTVTYDGQVIYSEDLDYDDRGWIDGIQRMQNGTGSQWTYGYDLRGRLETVTRDALPFADYTYDTNGNRLSTSGPFGSVTPAEVTVDARDRVLAYGDRTYTYRDDGSRATQTQSGQTVSYGYDVFGNLRSVDLGDGTVIDYVTDGQQRRIGKRVNGALTQRLLYRDALNPIAMLAADGSVETRFVYGTRPNVPDYMVRGGVTYRVVADHLGSPRLIVDVATGAIAQELRYDAFGRVLLDTNPGFQPFGFAGGLYDPQTGLVRLGARDYDPVLGRWTAPDALGFAGTMSNLYTYARNSPVTYLDVNGLAERSFPVDRDATTSFISEINEIAESGGADIPIGDFLKTLNLPEEELKRLNDRRGDITLKFPDPTQGEFCNSGEKTTVPIPGAGPLSLKIKDEFSGDIEVSEDSIKLDGLKGLSAGVGFARKGVDSLTIEPGLVTVEF